MKPKLLLIVVTLLAALAAGVFLLNRTAGSADPADARVGQPLLRAALAERTARVELSESGKTVKLRQSPPGTWVVESYHDLPADFAKLSTLVGNLTDARVERFVTQNPERLARLEFTDTRIALADADGKPLVALTLGKTAEGGGRFVRFDDEKKAYLSRVNVWLDTNARNWADTTLVHLAAADIARVAFDFADADAVVVSRSEAKSPFTAASAPAGQRLKTDTVTSLLGTLAGLRFTETSEPGDPLAIAARKAARTVTLTAFDGKTVVVAVGRQPERTVVKPDAVKAAPADLLGDAAKPAPAESSPEKAGPAAVVGPLTEKIPAGPVFAFVTHSDASAPVNALMKQRAFQVGESVLNTLPAAPAALFEPVPPPAPSP